MIEYYFLLFIAFIWIVFATVQDIKVREVANWLNFSLIAIFLFYRAFYSYETSNVHFFLVGLLGIGIFYLFSQALYYGRVFGGGDAKLLIGLGGIIPFNGYFETFLFGLFVIISLLIIGALYTLIYSLFLVKNNKSKFKARFSYFVKELNWKVYIIAISAAFFILWYGISFYYALCISILFFILLLLYTYLRAVDEACMIKLVNVNNLRVGDWLAEKVRFKGKIIGQSIHGLSEKDIILLRKRSKKVLVKNGVPFVPVFLICFLIMLYVFFSLGNILRLLPFLS